MSHPYFKPDYQLTIDAIFHPFFIGTKRGKKNDYFTHPLKKRFLPFEDHIVSRKERFLTGICRWVGIFGRRTKGNLKIPYKRNEIEYFKHLLSKIKEPDFSYGFEGESSASLDLGHAPHLLVTVAITMSLGSKEAQSFYKNFIQKHDAFFKVTDFLDEFWNHYSRVANSRLVYSLILDELLELVEICRDWHESKGLSYEKYWLDQGMIESFLGEIRK